MKKTQYNCENCGHKMITVDRDFGDKQSLIGCSKCEALAEYVPFVEDETKDPEMVWIKPLNDAEWKMITDQMESEIRMKYPSKKPRKVKIMTTNMMFRIKDHVNKGGLVQLPIHLVEALESYNQNRN